MWALVIVLAAEAIEARLLSLLVVRWWPGRFGLEGAVQALVPPVLRWAPRFNTLMPAAELDPPHGELAQAAAGRCSARGAIVRAHGIRQAIRPEQALEDGAGFRWLRREPGCAAEEQAAIGVSHRQGVALAAVAGAKLALDVRRPDGIRCLGLQRARSGMPVPPAACACLASPCALEEFAGGARCREVQLGTTLREGGQELARTPVQVSSLGFQEGCFYRL